VWLLIATALVGLLVVGLTRGSFGQMARLRVAAPWLLAAGLILQAVLEYIDLPRREIDTVGYGLLMASYALLLAFCVTNLRTRGSE